MVALEACKIRATHNLVPEDVTRLLPVHWLATNGTRETVRVPATRVAGDVDYVLGVCKRALAIKTIELLFFFG